jgi:hypothetical protein
MEEPEYDQEMIGIEPLGYSHHCPICDAELFWSCKHGKFACTKSGMLFSLEDILVYESDWE